MLSFSTYNMLLILNNIYKHVIISHITTDYDIFKIQFTNIFPYLGCIFKNIFKVSCKHL